MPEPLAYFLTWTTYGTWLPGDERGWVKRGHGTQAPDITFRLTAANRMTEPACFLNLEQRSLVEMVIRDHCELRSWTLYAVSCRTNHVHVVIEADTTAKQVQEQLKAWCTRNLKQKQRIRGEQMRSKWWTERGSQRFIADEASLEAVIDYVEVAQDRKDQDNGESK